MDSIDSVSYFLTTPKRDVPALEHFGAMGEGRRLRGHLLPEQDRDALAAEPPQHVEDLTTQLGREPERGLVEARARREERYGRRSATSHSASGAASGDTRWSGPSVTARP